MQDQQGTEHGRDQTVGSEKQKLSQFERTAMDGERVAKTNTQCGKSDE